MNPYTLEILARERQRDLLREAEAYRLAAAARPARGNRVLRALAAAGRSLLAPGRSARIEPNPVPGVQS